MPFNVVEIPKSLNNSNSAQIVAAMIENKGKAIEVPLEDKDSNSYRKTIRAAVSSRNLLGTHFFRTLVNPEKKVLLVWLEEKPKKDEAK